MSPKRILKLALVGVGALILFSVPPALWLFFSYYHQLENEVVARFSGKRWNIPSRIYSDSVLIYPGQDLTDLGFFERLARLNYHPVDPGNVTEPRRVQLRQEARQAGHLSAQLCVSVRRLRRRTGRAGSQGRCDRFNDRSGDEEADLLDRARTRAHQRHLRGRMGTAPAGAPQPDSADDDRRDPRRRGSSLLRASRRRHRPHHQGRPISISLRATCARAARR